VSDGIRARSRRGAIGESWWSKRFIAVLESLGFGARLTRGRAYARGGRVLDLQVEPGEVSARVQGSRARPYQVRIGLEPFGDADWVCAEKAMAERALFAARLLAGEMPTQIEEAFEACELSLFPRTAAELKSSCTCPDWANPCKHVAAVFYLLAEAFDESPFLVLTWRGRRKADLIEHLRALRGGAGGAAPTREPEPEDAGPPLEELLDRFYEAGRDLDELTVRPRAAHVPDAVLRQAGPVGVRLGRRDLVELLAPLYETMAREAERRWLDRD
jgi:uncharacterized Zn finger protein